MREKYIYTRIQKYSESEKIWTMWENQKSRNDVDRKSDNMKITFDYTWKEEENATSSY